MNRTTQLSKVFRQSNTAFNTHAQVLIIICTLGIDADGGYVMPAGQNFYARKPEYIVSSHQVGIIVTLISVACHSDMSSSPRWIFMRLRCQS